MPETTMTECCESIIRMDVRGETVSDSRSAEQKSRAPSEILQQVTDRRLTEVDCRVLRGVCHWTRLAKYGGGGLPVYIALCVIVAILNLIRL